LNEAVPIFEQYLDGLGTDGMCSIKDVDLFFQKFLSDYDNPYQASEVTINNVQSAANSGSENDYIDNAHINEKYHPPIACGGCHGSWSADPEINQSMREHASYLTEIGAGILGGAYGGIAALFTHAFRGIWAPPTNNDHGYIDHGGYGGGSDMSGLGGNPETDSIGGEGMSR
jgi:hypothetical protein